MEQATSGDKDISSSRIYLRLLSLFDAFCLVLQLFTLFIFFYTSLHFWYSFTILVDVSLSDMPNAYLSFEFQHFWSDSNEKNIRISKLKIDMSGDLRQRDFAV